MNFDRALASCVTEEEIAAGRIYPKLDRIRKISTTVATAVIERAFSEVRTALLRFAAHLTHYVRLQGVAQIARPDDITGLVKENMYKPDYLELQHA